MIPINPNYGSGLFKLYKLTPSDTSIYITENK